MHLDRACLIIEGAAQVRIVILKGAVVDSHGAVTQCVDARAELRTHGGTNYAGTQGMPDAVNSQVFEKRQDTPRSGKARHSCEHQVGQGHVSASVAKNRDASSSVESGLPLLRHDCERATASQAANNGGMDSMRTTSSERGRQREPA